jgi:hypothetical protein
MKKFLIVFFVLLKAGSLFFLCDARPEYDSTEYRIYLEQFGGRSDEEKQDAFDEIYQKLLSASGNINDLEDDYAQGQISQKEYLEQLSQVTKYKNEESVIKTFREKMVYASEDEQKHFVIHDYGWTQLLTEEHPDFLLVVLLFLLMVPVWCREYETEMYYLQLCSRNGRTRLTAVKIVMGSIMAVLLSLAFSLMEYLYYMANGGMEYGYAPVQSLAFFYESSLNL